MSEKNILWITSLDQISTASLESLRRSLLTCDGQGVKIKEAALNELLKREKELAIAQKKV